MKEPVNIREIPVGNYVLVQADGQYLMTCQVVEILRGDRISSIILEVSDKNAPYTIGQAYTFPLSEVFGMSIAEAPLRQLGFTDSDERGWRLVYWFGMDMKLLYRNDNHRQVASFRFKSTYRKTYVSISCLYVHQLQNIMRFLTGGELEFNYKTL